MRTLKKSKSIVIILLCALCCLLAGLIFFPNSGIKLASASAESNENVFLLQEDISVSPNAASPYLTFRVNLTDDIYEAMSTGKTETGLLKINKTEYYLQIRRRPYGAGNTSEDKTVFYHISPDDTMFSTEQLILEGKTAVMQFPFYEDTQGKYQYVCEYVAAKQTLTRNYGVLPLGWKLNRGIYTLVSSNTLACSVAEEASYELVNNAVDYTAEQLTYLQKLAGVNVSTETITVNLVYSQVLGYGQFKEVTEKYQIDGVYGASPALVYSQISTLTGRMSLSNYNGKYEDPYLSKIVLQADGYTYSFDNATQIGTLRITYRDFDYSNFAIRVQDNDISNNADLFVYLYTTKVSELSDGRICLTFDYATIMSQCESGLSWIFDLGKNNFMVANYSQHVSVELGDNDLKLYFLPEYEDELKDISIVAMAEIVPDYEVEVNLNYTSLKVEGNTIVEEERTQPLSMMHSEFTKLCYWSTFEQSSYYPMIANAVELKELGEQGYFIPRSVSGGAENLDEGVFYLNVEYGYNTLLAIEDKTNNTVRFIAATKNSLTYTYDDLGLAPAEGYRLLSFESDSPAVEIEFDESNYTEATLTLNVSTRDKLIIPIQATYTDTWKIVIEYLEKYKDTPFAVKKQKEATIKLAEYDVNNLTFEDVNEIAGSLPFTVGMVKADDKVKTEFLSDSTYKATLSYGYASLRTIDYDGNPKELKVPLTSYADWCASFGEEWSILYLNTKENKYFQYSNEVERENLYGHFVTAVFQHQVSDLNYYFRETTGDGHVTMFEDRSVQGSSIYRFGEKIQSKVGLGLLGHLMMWFCELVDDSNSMYYSYFLYLDGSTLDNCLTESGADDAWDTDDALDNKVEDVGDKIEDTIDGIKDKTTGWWAKFRDSSWDTVVLIVILVAAAFVVFVFAYKFLIWAGLVKDPKKKRKSKKKAVQKK